MIICGIDPSLTSAGVAIINGTRWPHVVLAGLSGNQNDSRELKAARIRAVRTRVMNLIPTGTDVVTIEGKSYGHNLPGSDERAHLWWLISDACDHLKIPFVVCPPATLKKHTTDNGAAKKPAVIAAIEKMWPGIQLPENPRAPLAERKADAADALALATLTAQHYGQPVPYTVLERHKLALTKIDWPQLPTTGDTLAAVPADTSHQKRMTEATR